MSVSFIKQQIDRFESRGEYGQHSTKERMRQGELYYKQLNEEIMERKKQYFSDERAQPIDDPFRSNNKLPSGYMKLLVKQKVNYSINDKLAIKGDQAEEIEQILGKPWRKDFKATGEKASQKMYAVWQFYINSNGELDYKKIPSEQVIPYYENEELTRVIRYYETEGEHMAELWNSQLVTYYRKDDNGKWQELGSKAHMVRKTMLNDEVVDEEGDSWGRPPFAILWNNEEKQTDLDPVKAYIDIYDVVDSDFANNIEDFQDAWWVLKNFDGQDIDEFFTQVKKYKALKVGNDGEARAEQMEIPTEARMKFLDKTEKLIYKFGMGVNPDDIEGNITNVRIKALYSNLDLKANDFEQMVREFFFQVLYFINVHRGINNESAVDENGIDLEFDRSMIINEVEKSELANKSKGYISEETRLSHDPRVKNAKEEINKMQQEREDYINLDNISANG